MPRKLIVLALGGNALIKDTDKPSLEIQFKNASEVVKDILNLAKNNNIIITHGNGPQVGNILLQVESAAGVAYRVPLEVCVAESQGEIGYIIEQTLRNYNKKAPVISILTQVLVSKKDPAFKNPTKFIGPFYNQFHAHELSEKGFTIKQDGNRGYRRVVPSPQPLKILESTAILSLVKNHNIAIAAGGGGIPVIQKNGKLKGIEAVIDKDLASSCLAISIKANYLILLTNIPQVYINFNKPNQQALSKVNLKEIKQYYKESQFPPGSMGPKIQSAIQFLEKNKKGKVIITDFKTLDKALQGKAGTIITKD